MDKMTSDQLKRLYNSDKPLFLELSEGWRNSDPEYFKNFVSPILNPSQNKVEKKDSPKLINISIAALSALIIIVGAYFVSVDKSKKSENILIGNKTEVISPPEKLKTQYESALEIARSGNYKVALYTLEQIDKTDSNYAAAQDKIKELKGNIERDEKLKSEKNKRKIELTNKYEKLMKSGLYLYEIEKRLQRDGFKMTDSKFEKAPDGSNGIRQYFTNHVYGFNVDIWLQSAYSLGSYYTDVSVYEN